MAIIALLRQRHHIEPGQEDNFNIRRPDEVIKAQIEAALLTVFGGVLGIGAGVVACLVFGNALGWPMALPVDAIAAVPVLAAAIGMTFGLYPAARAARLDPIAALHHE